MRNTNDQPSIMSKGHFYSDGYTTSGPISIRELAELYEESPEKVKYVWLEGMKDWEKAGSYQPLLDEKERKEAEKRRKEEEKKREEERRKREEEKETENDEKASERKEGKGFDKKHVQEQANARKKGEKLKGWYLWVLITVGCVFVVGGLILFIPSDKENGEETTTEGTRAEGESKSKEKDKGDKPLNAKETVRSFIEMIGKGKLKEAHALQDNPLWEDYERFSSVREGYGAVDKTYIYDLKQEKNKVYAHYYSSDPVNGDGIYKQYFFVEKRKDDKWKIVDSGLKEGSGEENDIPEFLHGFWKKPDKNSSLLHINSDRSVVTMNGRCHFVVEITRKEKYSAFFKVFLNHYDGVGCPSHRVEDEEVTKENPIAKFKISEKSPEEIKFKWFGLPLKSRDVYILEGAINLNDKFYLLEKRY